MELNNVNVVGSVYIIKVLGHRTIKVRMSPDFMKYYYICKCIESVKWQYKFTQFYIGFIVPLRQHACRVGD